MPMIPPVQLLAPVNGKTKTGRLWIYVRDDRPVGSREAPAFWFAFSSDRKGEHPRRSKRQTELRRSTFPHCATRPSRGRLAG